MIFCPQCRLQQPREHRYCVACGTDLPTHLVAQRPEKVARFFAGIKVAEADPEHGFLKVSCYRKDQRLEGADSTLDIASAHVRFSVWVDDVARCVLSLPVGEATALAAFLQEELDAADSSLAATRIG